MEKITWNALKKFRCIADQCPDSCCKDWEVDVDEESAATYRALKGDLGDRLRQVLKEDNTMTIVDGRCPMWRQDGLCEIQAQEGHDALCHTCQTFPRLCHEYEEFTERDLELSCPEAARLIFSAKDHRLSGVDVPGGEAPEYDEEAMEILLRTREQARRILSNFSRSANEVLALLLMYGYQAQAELDGAEAVSFDPDAALEEALSFAQPDNGQEMLDFFAGLEILTGEWSVRLATLNPTAWKPEHQTLARYFVDRYWLQAVSDYDLIGRVKLAVVSCLLIRTIGGSLIPTAQLYSKEIENSIDNVEALLDGAYASPAFTDDRLLGMLLL